ncbi:MAG: hypothetical protein CVU05_01965 [Bacteroidetes bacterium HGW-Bacteroidetes-21]|jgi:RHS repeat-associated protein|nr:MAG: hypothetical protein CVU05_01965 [Bacteroidetes bacterium HGW-Bacteroidetes-21]
MTDIPQYWTEIPDKGRYCYGFNGKEKDDEITGQTGSHLDFGARIYDSRIGRWLACDPLAAKYPDLSTYNFVANSPLIFIDPDGKDIIWVGDWTAKQKRAQKAMLKTQWGKAVYRQFNNSKTDDIYIAASSEISGKAVTSFNVKNSFTDNFYFPWETPTLEYQNSYVPDNYKKFVNAFNGQNVNNIDARMHLLLVASDALEGNEYQAAALINHDIIAHILVPLIYGKDLPEKTEHDIVGGNQVGNAAKNRSGSIQEDINNDAANTQKNGEGSVDKSQQKLERVEKEVNEYKTNEEKE